MIRRDRARGRHRIGLALVSVPRRLWDRAARQAAAELQRDHPGWTILYGTASRRFYAFAAWPTPQPMTIEARTPAELRAHLSTAVLTVLTHRPIP